MKTRFTLIGIALAAALNCAAVNAQVLGGGGGVGERVLRRPRVPGEAAGEGEDGEQGREARSGHRGVIAAPRPLCRALARGKAVGTRASGAAAGGVLRSVNMRVAKLSAPLAFALMGTVCATLYRGFKRNGWL